VTAVTESPAHAWRHRAGQGDVRRQQRGRRPAPTRRDSIMSNIAAIRSGHTVTLSPLS